MKSGTRLNRWRPWVGALGILAVAFGVALQLEGAPVSSGGASSTTSQAPRVDTSSTTLNRTTAEPRVISAFNSLNYESLKYRSGRIPKGGLKVVSVSRTDWRNDEGTRLREAGKLVGPMPSPYDDSNVAAGRPVCEPPKCTFDIECIDLDPCTIDSCDLPAGVGTCQGTCIHEPVPRGQPGGCEDGLFCNGIRTCVGAKCDANSPASVKGDCSGGVCIGTTGNVGASCSVDADCNELCDSHLDCGVQGVCLAEKCTALNPLSEGRTCGDDNDCNTPGAGQCLGGVCDPTQVVAACCPEGEAPTACEEDAPRCNDDTTGGKEGEICESDADCPGGKCERCQPDCANGLCGASGNYGTCSATGITCPGTIIQGNCVCPANGLDCKAGTDLGLACTCSGADPTPPCTGASSDCDGGSECSADVEPCVPDSGTCSAGLPNTEKCTIDDNCDTRQCVGGPSAGKPCTDVNNCTKCVGGPNDGKACNGFDQNKDCNVCRSGTALNERCTIDLDCSGCDDGVNCNGLELCLNTAGSACGGADSGCRCEPAVLPCGPDFAVCNEGECRGGPNSSGCNVDADCTDVPFACDLSPLSASRIPFCHVGRCCSVVSGGQEGGPEPVDGIDCKHKSLSACASEHANSQWYPGDDGEQTLQEEREGACGGRDPENAEPTDNFGCPLYSRGITMHSSATQPLYPVLVGPVSLSPQDAPGPGGPFGQLYQLGDDYHFSVCQSGADVDKACTCSGTYPCTGGSSTCAGGAECSDTGLYLQLEIVRWVGEMLTANRISIDFYDFTGTFIEDTVVEPLPAGFGLHIWIISEPLVIPSHGYVVMRAAEDFEADTQFVWASATNVCVENDPVAGSTAGEPCPLGTECTDSDTCGTGAGAVGTNDPNVLWINKGPASNYLKMCQGGINKYQACAGRCVGAADDGEACQSGTTCLSSTCNLNLDCPGSTCGTAPGILALELVGDKAPTLNGPIPIGSCVDKDTGRCEDDVFSWDCRDSRIEGVCDCTSCQTGADQGQRCACTGADTVPPCSGASSSCAGGAVCGGTDTVPCDDQLSGTCRVTVPAGRTGEACTKDDDCDRPIKQFTTGTKCAQCNNAPVNCRRCSTAPNQACTSDAVCQANVPPGLCNPTDTLCPGFACVVGSNPTGCSGLGDDATCDVAGECRDGFCDLSEGKCQICNLSGACEATGPDCDEDSDCNTPGKCTRGNVGGVCGTIGGTGTCTCPPYGTCECPVLQGSCNPDPPCTIDLDCPFGTCQRRCEDDPFTSCTSNANCPSGQCRTVGQGKTCLPFCRTGSVGNECSADDDCDAVDSPPCSVCTLSTTNECVGDNDCKGCSITACTACGGNCIGGWCIGGTCGACPGPTCVNCTRIPCTIDDNCKRCTVDSALTCTTDPGCKRCSLAKNKVCDSCTVCGGVCTGTFCTGGTCPGSPNQINCCGGADGTCTEYGPCTNTVNGTCQPVLGTCAPDDGTCILGTVSDPCTIDSDCFIPDTAPCDIPLNGACSAGSVGDECTANADCDSPNHNTCDLAGDCGDAACVALPSAGRGACCTVAAGHAVCTVVSTCASCGGTCNASGNCTGGTCGACPGVACTTCCPSATGTFLGLGSTCDADNGYDPGNQHCCEEPQATLCMGGPNNDLACPGGNGDCCRCMGRCYSDVNVNGINDVDVPCHSNADCTAPATCRGAKVMPSNATCTGADLAARDLSCKDTAGGGAGTCPVTIVQGTCDCPGADTVPCDTPNSGICTAGKVGYACTIDDNCDTRQCSGGVFPGDPCSADTDCKENGVCNVVDNICVRGLRKGLGCANDIDCQGAVSDGDCRLRWSGADDCEDARVAVVTVPAPGSPAKIVNITGDQRLSTNTFAHPDRGFGQSLSPFQPRGWWEAFSIDKCARVRVDWCCSDPVRQPQYDAIIGGSCVGGTGVPTQADLSVPGQLAYDRGTPYCPEDNLWGTYGFLAGPSTYFIRAYDQIDSPQGQYQAHVTIEACPEAACCYEACTGGARNGLTCTGSCRECGGNCQSNGVCTGGSCTTETCDCPKTNPGDPNPGPSCDRKCAQVNQPDCNALSGFSLQVPQVYGGNEAGGCAVGLRCNGGSNAGKVCSTAGADALCSVGGGTCVLQDITCLRGACCTGPGVCFDDRDADIPALGMTQAQCEGDPDFGGSFIGGSQCRGGTCVGGADEGRSCQTVVDCALGATDCIGLLAEKTQELPCPVCESEAPGHCQTGDGALAALVSYSDETFGAGLAVADDFIFHGGNVTQICVWGSYVNLDFDKPDAYDCAPSIPSDTFRIRIYKNLDGRPDTSPSGLVAERRASGIYDPQNPPPDQAVTRVEDTRITVMDNIGTGVKTYGFQISLDGSQTTGGLNNAPIPQSAFTIDDCYWLEVVATTPDTATNKLCEWGWLRLDTTNGNRYAVSGSSVAGYAEGSEVHWDQWFCMNIAVDPQLGCGRPEAACCGCGGDCLVSELEECALEDNTWHAGEATCANASTVCVPPPNDVCENAVEVGVGTFAFNNGCATTEEAIRDVDSDFGTNEPLVKDLWFHFTVPENPAIPWTEGQQDSYCTLIASACGTGEAAFASAYLDFFMAVYHNKDDRENCVCPHSNAVQEQYAMDGNGLATPNWASDENCFKQAVGGPSFSFLARKYPPSGGQGSAILPGDCFTIRVGGFGGQGSEAAFGTVDISCGENFCGDGRTNTWFTCSTAPTQQCGEGFGPCPSATATDDKCTVPSVEECDPGNPLAGIPKDVSGCGFGTLGACSATCQCLAEPVACGGDGGVIDPGHECDPDCANCNKECSISGEPCGPTCAESCGGTCTAGNCTGGTCPACPGPTCIPCSNGYPPCGTGEGTCTVTNTGKLISGCYSGSSCLDNQTSALENCRCQSFCGSRHVEPFGNLEDCDMGSDGASGEDDRCPGQCGESDDPDPTKRCKCPKFECGNGAVETLAGEECEPDRFCSGSGAPCGTALPACPSGQSCVLTPASNDSDCPTGGPCRLPGDPLVGCTCACGGAQPPIEPVTTCQDTGATAAAGDGECRTRALTFRMALPAGSPATSAAAGASAIKVTMVDLQHPRPSNAGPVPGPSRPPTDFTAWDTRSNGLCNAGSHTGHHCDTDADCRVCQGGDNENRNCTGAADCPSGSCPAAPPAGVCASLKTCTAEAAETPGGVGGCARWVGEPLEYLQKDDKPEFGSYRASRLQCSPFYHNWENEPRTCTGLNAGAANETGGKFCPSTVPGGVDCVGAGAACGVGGTVNVIGAEIMPSSRYGVQSYGEDCKGIEGTCTNVSAEVTMTTRRFGDLIALYNPPSTTKQPGGDDVAAAVNKFQNKPGVISKLIAQVQPNAIDPNQNQGGADIVAIVDAFKGFKYALVPGPCICPSPISCTLACAGLGTACGTGGSCAAVCQAGGPRAGKPCNFNLDCGSCSGGTADGAPCKAGAAPNYCPGGSCTTGVCGANQGSGGGGCDATVGGTDCFCRDACGRCN